MKGEGEFGDSRLISVGDRLGRFADPLAPTAEDLLLEKEALDLAGLKEIPVGKQRLKLSPDEIHEVLARLPSDEAEAIVAYFGAEQRQRDTAARMGISQPGVHYRISRGIKRLKWITGPGSWFTPADLERDLRGRLTPDEVHALGIYWRTTSVSMVQIEMGIATHPEAWRLLRGAVAQLRGRYARGFEALVKFGKLLLATTPAQYSAAEDFVRRRCTFTPSGRVSRAKLIVQFERHALARRTVVDVEAMIERLALHHVGRCTVVEPSDGTRSAGFRGIRLSDESSVRS